MSPELPPGDDELPLLEAWLAGDLPADEAETWAARVAADPALAAKAEELAANLALAAGLRGALGEPDPERAAEPSADLGDYELLGELARGGQGVVHRARQRSTGRDVALKLLAAGDGPARRRFEREIELVASLDHPHIVRVFDQGETADGRPFVVMELVDGLPLDRWADEQQPDLTARLELFDDLCKAVAHAHRHGVIHRDLKPANVLVDGTGAPRVLDFGIAKLHDPERSLLTAEGEFLGTLAYAAPEQLSGDPGRVDARADVHGLGLLLYRLLTGEHALPVGEAPATVLRHVLETEPAPPSRRAPGLDADLDALVLTCLAKDPDDRYPAVEALRADLRRWHADEPLAARSDWRGYVLRKTLRRYRVPLAALAVVLVALTVATLVSLDALAESRRQARRAHDLGSFLTDSLSAATLGAEPRDRTVVELMRQAARDVAGRFPDDPASEGVIRATLAHVLGASSEFEEAARHGQQALELLEGALGPLARETLHARRVLAELAHRRGDLDQAEQRFAALRPDVEQALDPLDVERVACLRSLASLRVTQGRGAEAVTLLEGALAPLVVAVGDDDLEVLATRHSLAEALRAAGRTEQALELIEAVERARARLLGEDHGRTLVSRHNRANLLAELGRLEESEAVYGAVAEQLERLAGPTFSGTLQARANHAAALAHLKRSADARRLYEQLLPVCTEQLGGDHPLTLQAHHGLGVALKSEGRYAEAAVQLEAAREGRLAALGADHPDTIRSTVELAVALGPSGPLARVEELLRDGLARSERVFGRDDRTTLTTTHTLAVLLLDTGRLEDADALWSDLLPRSLAALGEEDWTHWNYAGQHGLCLLRLGRLDEGAALVEQAWEGLAATLGEGAPHTRGMAGLLAQVAGARGDAEAAAAWSARAAADEG